MKTGKLPEPTLKRSVLNPCRYRSDRTELRPAVGHDGAVYGNMVTAIAATALYYVGNELYACNNAINNVIAAGGKPVAISLAVLLPEHTLEPELYRIMDSIYRFCEKKEIDVIAGHTEITDTVNEPVVTVTAYGDKIFSVNKGSLKNLDIVMTGYTGTYGTAVLAMLKREELITKYPESYIDYAASFMNDISITDQIKVIEEMGGVGMINAMHDVSTGGIFGALWELCESAKVGMLADVSSMNIKQETIEVCEFFSVNPYMLNGLGSMLYLSKDGEKLCDAFHKINIEASVIGRTNDSKDRKIAAGGEERFLTPPKVDMLGVVFNGIKMPV